MSYRIRLQLEAIDDIQSAYAWYERQRAGLGDEFVRELEICYDKLSEHPQHYTSINKYYRRIRVDRFPYVVVYEIEGSEVIINAVHHTSRKPRF
ncbi:MAG: type II toxin-antitoxin system RelE/ParE family toxin [Williamsia sp.]|nr:type II toxin-antitoxin system RelE/ParE family toxin [Williamsia sp.]